jgi:glycosyltransferase involved in cell wall biosynthesis
VIVLLKKLPYFIRAFRADDLDIVHTNNGLRWHIAPIIAAKLLSIPIICHLQGQDPMTSLDRLLIPAVDRFIVLNNQALSLYRQYISPNKIVVIPNAVITDDYSTASPCATKFQIKSPAVGVVGRLVRWKGQDTLVRAIPHVLKEVPNATFYIVGAADPPDESDFEDQLKALASELGVTSSVVFTGWANDTKPIFKQLDVSVCSSINPEPFGLVLVESMVLGTPVVATRQGGPLDIITDEKDGLLYDPGNHVALSKSIIKLLTDVELRQKMSLAGREKVLKKFSLEAVMRKLEATYVSLLSEVH